MNVTEIQKEPESVQEALSSSKKEAAMQNEMESVKINEFGGIIQTSQTCRVPMGVKRKVCGKRSFEKVMWGRGRLRRSVGKVHSHRTSERDQAPLEVLTVGLNFVECMNAITAHLNASLCV